MLALTPRTLWTVAALATIAGLGAAPTAESLRLPLRPGSRIRIEGDSNLHKWACDTTTLSSDLRLDQAGPETLPTRVEKANVSLPVGSLSCGNSKIDDNLRKALNAKVHPEITFELTRAEFATPARPDTVDATVVGTLTVAGTSRELKMKVVARETGDGGLAMEGVTTLLMSDWGVKPPTALLGLLKTDDAVTVRIDFTADFAELLAKIPDRPKT